MRPMAMLLPIFILLLAQLDSSEAEDRFVSRIMPRRLRWLR